MICQPENTDFSINQSYKFYGDGENIYKKLSYHKQTMHLLHNTEIRVLY